MSRIVANPTTAKAGAPTLDIYEDFQCPACGQVEQALGSTIKKMADAGEVKVIYHMQNFLDANLNNDSSTRAGISSWVRRYAMVTCPPSRRAVRAASIAVLPPP